MLKLDKSIWTRWEVALLIFIIIVSLVIAGSYASYAIIFTGQNPADSGLVVENGDTVYVDYIGMFEDGTVFDTSIRAVAENNTLYPKSSSFSARGEYTPLSFNVGTGQMISGFDKGVVGMSVNQTKVLTLSPSEAYGLLDESLLEVRQLTEVVPVFEWFGNVSTFYDFYGINPEIGMNVKNPTWGWNMTVFHVDVLSEKVLMRNNPYLHEVVVSSFGWQSIVVSMDSSANNGVGEIVITHMISPVDVGTKTYYDEFGNPFTLSSLDAVAGTFTLDFNREVVGRTLIFKVTVVFFTKAP